MLVVTVELWPFGDAERARVIGRMGIANLTTTAGVADYVVVLKDDTAAENARLVMSHPRSDGFWPLLARAAASRYEPEMSATSSSDVETVVRSVSSKVPPVQ